MQLQQLKAKDKQIALRRRQEAMAERKKKQRVLELAGRKNPDPMEESLPALKAKPVTFFSFLSSCCSTGKQKAQN